MSTSAESWSRMGDPVQLTGEKIYLVNRASFHGTGPLGRVLKQKLSKHTEPAAVLGGSSLGSAVGTNWVQSPTVGAGHYCPSLEHS